MRDRVIKINLTKAYKDNTGFIIPVTEYRFRKSDENTQKLLIGSPYDNILDGDSFNDSVSLDEELSAIWFNFFESAEEWLFGDEKEELEEWLKSFLSHSEAYIVIGYMQKMYESK